MKSGTKTLSVGSIIFAVLLCAFASLSQPIRAENMVTVTVGGQPSDVAVTPDGEYAYVTSTSQNNSAVSVISTTTNKVTATIKVDGSNGVAITPDGKYAYVTSQFSEPPNIDENFVSVISTVSNKVTAKIPLSGFLRVWL